MARGKPGTGPRTRDEAGARIRSDRPCACGCGELTFLRDMSDPRNGVRAGDANLYLQGHHVRTGKPASRVDLARGRTPQEVIEDVCRVIGYRGTRQEEGARP